MFGLPDGAAGAPARWTLQVPTSTGHGGSWACSIEMSGRGAVVSGPDAMIRVTAARAPSPRRCPDHGRWPRTRLE
jgi:hypothetical protein